VALSGLYRDISGSVGLATVGLLALVLDRHISWNYLNNTATDIWALPLLAAAVLCFRFEKNALMGAMLALAVSSKLFPSLAFLPLLLFRRDGAAALSFVVVAPALMVPWLLWDANGFVHNALIFALLVPNESSSWLAEMPASAALLVRVVAPAAALWLWWRLWRGEETRLFFTVALVNILLLLTGPQLHNNYLPWASVWVVAAILEDSVARDQSPPQLV